MNNPMEFIGLALVGLVASVSLTLATQSGCSSGTCPDVDEESTREGTYTLDSARTLDNFEYYIDGDIDPVIHEGATLTIEGDRITTTWIDDDGVEHSQIWATTERGFEFSPDPPTP